MDSPDTPTYPSVNPTPDGPPQAPPQAPDPSQVAPMAPAPDLPQPATAQPVAAPGHLWQSVLQGALSGLAKDGVVGAAAGAVNGPRDAAAKQVADSNNAQMASANIKFASAHAAAAVAEAHNQDQALHFLPQKLQDEANARTLDLANRLRSYGVHPTLSANNTHDGATGALIQLTDRDGAVGDFDYLSQGDQVHAYDTPSVVNSGGGQSFLNEYAQMVGLPPVDSKTPTTVKTKMFSDATNLLTSVPATSKDAMVMSETLKNYINTYSQRPDAVPQIENQLRDRQKFVESVMNHYDDHEANQAGKIAQAKQDFKPAKGGDSPVFAYDPKQDATVLTTNDAAQTAGMTAVRKVKQADIAAATHDNNVLETVTRQLNGVTATADALDQGGLQSALISSALDDAKLKLGAHAAGMGAEIPVGVVSDFFKNKNQKDATPQTLAYITSVLNLREAVMGMQKLQTGSARASESQINALMATLPGYEQNSGIAHQKLQKFATDVSVYQHNVPIVPGNPRTKIDKPPQAGQGGSY